MGFGVWGLGAAAGGLSRGCLCSPRGLPSIVRGHLGSPIHKTAKASSLGVHGRRRRGGDNWEGERETFFYSRFEAHQG